MLKTDYTRLGAFGFSICTVILAVACIYGYIENFSKVLHIINDPVTNMFIFRCSGIFAFPLGCILGYF